MADAADFASLLEEEQRQAAIARATAAAPGRGPTMWYCEDCLQAIPEARRKALPSCTRCVECQSMVEARQ